MDLAKLNPWNWFKTEEERDRNAAGNRDAELQPRQADPLTSLHREIDRLFTHAFEGFGFDSPSLSAHGKGIFRPKVDIAGNEKEYAVAVELPGVDEKDIHIDLSGNELTISAERRHEEKSDEKGFYRMERSYGSFQRVLTLPEDADAGAVRAGSKNGVVTITIPRIAGAKAAAKRIPIE